jgi:hypothetical protein
MKKMIKDDIKDFEVPGLDHFWMGNDYFPVRCLATSFHVSSLS